MRQAGVRRLAMLTGDARAIGENITSQAGLDETYAELLPADKVRVLEELLAANPRKGSLCTWETA
jgi:Cd2+/Zn2+-exporting ATPase